MKKTIIIGIVAILISSSLGAVALPETENNESQLVESISFSNPQIIDNEDYLTIHLNEATSYLMKPGQYQLPAVTRVFKFPFKTKINDVTVSFSEKHQITVSKKICLASEPIPDVYDNIKYSKVVENSEIYPLGLYPEKQYSYNVAAGRDGDKLVNFVSVKITPIQFDSSDNKLYYVNGAEIKINYKLPDNPTKLGDEYDLIIITNSRLARATQSLVDHKNSHNIRTKLVTLDEIYDGTYFPVEGRDCAEEVKYFIKNAFDEWGIKYALLVGGRKGGLLKEKWWVPVRYSNLHDGSDEYRFLTDLYFSDIYDDGGNFSSWDTNENGIFGEWIGMDKDILDMYPEVYVGRLACINALEAKIMVNKIIEYENNAYGTEWFKRFVGVAGDTYPAQGDPYYEGELATEAAFGFIESSGFEATYLWTSTGTFTDKSDVINGTNDGCGFLHFSGHGSHWSWANHPPHDEHTWIRGPNAFDMMDLSNGEKQPIVLVGGCHNAQFNTSLANFILGFMHEGFKYFSTEPPVGSFWYREWIPKCWAQSMANRMNKGCIAIMANSGYGYGISGEQCLEGRGRFMELMFFKSYSDGYENLGETHGNDLAYYMNEFPPMDNNIDCKIVQQWVLLGDPSLMIGGYA